MSVIQDFIDSLQRNKTTENFFAKAIEILTKTKLRNALKRANSTQVAAITKNTLIEAYFINMKISDGKATGYIEKWKRYEKFKNPTEQVSESKIKIIKLHCRNLTKYLIEKIEGHEISKDARKIATQITNSSLAIGYFPEDTKGNKIKTNIIELANAILQYSKIKAEIDTAPKTSKHRSEKEIKSPLNTDEFRNFSATNKNTEENQEKEVAASIVRKIEDDNLKDSSKKTSPSQQIYLSWKKFIANKPKQNKKLIGKIDNIFLEKDINKLSNLDLLFAAAIIHNNNESRATLKCIEKLMAEYSKKPEAEGLQETIQSLLPTLALTNKTIIFDAILHCEPEFQKAFTKALKTKYGKLTYLDFILINSDKSESCQIFNIKLLSLVNKITGIIPKLDTNPDINVIKCLIENKHIAALGMMWDITTALDIKKIERQDIENSYKYMINYQLIKIKEEIEILKITNKEPNETSTQISVQEVATIECATNFDNLCEQDNSSKTKPYLIKEYKTLTTKLQELITKLEQITKKEKTEVFLVKTYEYSQKDLSDIDEYQDKISKGLIDIKDFSQPAELSYQLACKKLLVFSKLYAKIKKIDDIFVQITEPLMMDIVFTCFFAEEISLEMLINISKRCDQENFNNCAARWEQAFKPKNIALSMISGLLDEFNKSAEDLNLENNEIGEIITKSFDSQVQTIQEFSKATLTACKLAEITGIKAPEYPTQLNTIGEEISSLVEARSSLMKENTNFKVNIVKANTDLETKTCYYDTFATCSALKKTLLDANDSCKELSKANEEIKLKIEEKSTTENKHLNKLKACITESLNTLFKSKYGHNCKHKQELRKLVERNQSLGNQLQQISTKLSKNIILTMKKESEIKEIKADLDEKKTRLNQAFKSINKSSILLFDKQQITHDIFKIDEYIILVTEKILSLSTEIVNSNKDKEQLNIDNQNLNIKIIQLNEKIKKLKTKIKKKQERALKNYYTFENRLSKQKKESKKSLDAQLSEIYKLNSQITTAVKKIDNQKKQISQLREKIQKTTKDRNDLNNRQTSRQLEKLQHQVNSLKQQVKTSKESLNDKDKLIEKLNDEIERLKQVLGTRECNPGKNSSISTVNNPTALLGSRKSIEDNIRYIANDVRNVIKDYIQSLNADSKYTWKSLSMEIITKIRETGTKIRETGTKISKNASSKDGKAIEIISAKIFKVIISPYFNRKILSAEILSKLNTINDLSTENERYKYLKLASEIAGQIYQNSFGYSSTETTKDQKTGDLHASNC